MKIKWYVWREELPKKFWVLKPWLSIHTLVGWSSHWATGNLSGEKWSMWAFRHIVCISQVTWCQWTCTYLTESCNHRILSELSNSPNNCGKNSPLTHASHVWTSTASKKPLFLPWAWTRSHGLSLVWGDWLSHHHPYLKHQTSKITKNTTNNITHILHIINWRQDIHTAPYINYVCNYFSPYWKVCFSYTNVLCHIFC